MRTSPSHAMQQIYTMWLAAYALPALAAGAAMKSLPKKGAHEIRDAVITHVALIVSILISQYLIRRSGLAFPWPPHGLSIAAYLAGMMIAAALIGRWGVWYGLSALLQQGGLGSILFLLLPVLPIHLIVVLIVPLFVWGHTIRTKRWRVRMAILTAWGVLSIVLFSALQDVFLLAAMHTVLGSALIRRALIYPAE